MLATIACLTRAAALILALALSLGAMSLPAAADILGRWQTFNGLGFTFTFDVQAQSGSPGGTRTLSGEITPTGTFDADCLRVAPGDRFRQYVCERLSKDGPFPLHANLTSSRGQAVLTGTDRNSGATLRLMREEGTAAPLAKLTLTLDRLDGTTETMTLVARKRDVRAAPQALIGNWIGTDGGLTLEARIEPVDDDRVAVALSAFADQALPVPAGRPLDEWHRIAGSERAFSMSATAGRVSDQPQGFYGTVLTREGEFADRIGAGAEIKPTQSGKLQMVLTGAGLGGVPPVYVTLAPADRPLRQVAPTRNVPDMMNGQWVGNSGPLVIEADIEMNEEGEMKATLHAFADETRGGFPREAARAFTWFHEVVDKRQPFGLSFYGNWNSRRGFVAGRSESGKTNDFGVEADTRIRRIAADELSLALANPGDSAFDDQPMRLVRRSTPLRPVPPLEGDAAKPAVGSHLAGTWVWSSSPNRRGNVIMLELAGEDLRSVEGSIKVWNTNGTCETFQRTQALCELGRDDGPMANAIRLDPTGDDRWPYDALEGLRAFGKEFPAYSDLRMRLRAVGNDTLAVQMTAADAFGAQPDNTYLFEKVGINDAILVPSLDERAYVARPDDPAPGACRAWAKDDSLLRQKNLPELTAKLDAILADQKIGLSGHPLDLQCKQMLDDMADAGLDPAKEDGGIGGGSQQAQEPASSGPIVGTWRMVGQPHFSYPEFGRWGPAPALRPILAEIEVSGAEGQYSASEKDGPFASTLTTHGIQVEALRVHLEKSIPETGAASLVEWLGTPEFYLAGGGGNGLGWLDDQDSFYQEIGLLVAGDRALLLTSGQFYGDGGLAHMHMIGVVPQKIGVAAFERVAPGASEPTPDPLPESVDPEVVNSDPIHIPVPRKPEPNAVCQALERRTAELNAQAGTELVQAIRSIYADVGLAFGGEQTEAKCQRALDRLNAIMLVPETRGDGQSGQNGGGNTYLIDNSVNVFNTFVDNGGDWHAPNAPDPCAALDTVSAMLTFSGGMGMGGFLEGIFVEVGISLTGPRRPELCYDAMLYLWDFGVDPALDDGGWGVVRFIHDADREPRRPDRNPAESRACRAYNAFTAALLAKGGTEMVQFLRGYAIDRGFGMGSTREPSPADCARMLAELRDLGLDPDLPDGGLSFASDFLPEERVAPPAVVDRTGGYDARPETELELANWLDGSPYTYAVPGTGELQQIGELADVVAFITPPEGLLGSDRARPGDENACMDRRQLPRDEGFRAWAAMRELMRHFVPPGSILSGRDCALVEVATEMAFATMGDPSFAHGEDEFVSVILDRRLDGTGLGADDRQFAGRTVGAMLREPEPTETHPWRAVVTTPEIVAAVTGHDVPHGSFLVWNHGTGTVAGPFRMRLSGETR